MQPRGATPRSRSGAEVGRTPCPKGGGQEELPHVRGQGQLTLSAKVRLVKAMVFPVVMYGCKSWTIKKAEQRRIDALDCGAGEDS